MKYKYTTIQISLEVKKLLDKIGKKGESYNTILLNLLKSVKK